MYPDTAEKELDFIVHIGKSSPLPIRSSTSWILIENLHTPVFTIENLQHEGEDAVLIDATGAWEEEKHELERARDEALARADTADNW